MGYIYGIVPSIFEEGACICQFHLCRLQPVWIESDQAVASSDSILTNMLEPITIVLLIITLYIQFSIVKIMFNIMQYFKGSSII